MEEQLGASRAFEAQLGARLNLGDARAARSEQSLARDEYEKALALAEKERLGARAAGDLSRYANATSWSALAHAKLGRAGDAYARLEEAERYVGDDAESWNLRASAMRALGLPRKAIASARVAVALAERSPAKPLKLAICRYTLVTALLDAGESDEAADLLARVADALRSPELDALRGRAERLESFEVYSSARGDVAAYVSLRNRAQIRLASIYEERGEIDRARQEYQRVLAWRSDDATALAALARLARSDAERERTFADAFDADPFSMALVREYRRSMRRGAPLPAGDTTGSAMRRALILLERGETRAAAGALDGLLAAHPANETLRALRREAQGPDSIEIPSPTPTAAELRALVNGFDRLKQEQRVALDAAAFESVVAFAAPSSTATPGVTVFESGTIEGIPFRFGGPTAFAGSFADGAPLRLTYRILGVTRSDGAAVLLLEPVRLERVR